MSFYMRSPVYTPNDPMKSVKQMHSWLYQLNENLRYMFSNLDSDNFSSEFAVLFSSENTQKTQSAIENMERDLSKLMAASEWENLSVTGCVILNADTRPCILLDGQTAFISGGALLSNDLENGHARTIMNLPEKYRPGRTQYRVSCVSSGLLLFEIGHTGEVILTNLTGATVLNETYIPFSISYAI